MSNKTSIISAVVGALLVTTSLLIVSKTYSNSEDNSLGYTLSNWQGAINVLQWNPHWQCFKNPACASTVADKVASLASQHSLDFANLIELEDNNWKPSDPKYKLGSGSRDNHRISCGQDMLITMYDSSKWTPLSDGHAGCLVYSGRKDRPYLVQTFKLNADPSMKVVFVGAHFSHPGDGSYDSGLSQHLHNSIKEQQNQFQVQNVVMAADTNAYDNTSSDSLWSKMNLGGMKLATTLEKTCCKEAKTNFTYPYPFDRVMSNFGKSMQTILPITENPSWAGEEYHKPVIGKMTV